MKHSPEEIYAENDDLKNAVNDFEATWKKSLKKSYSSHVIDGRNGTKSSEYQKHHDTTANVEDSKEKLHSYHPSSSRSSSMSSVSSQSTSLSHAGITPPDVSIVNIFYVSFVYLTECLIDSLPIEGFSEVNY